MLAGLGMEAVDITSSSLKDGHLEVFAVGGAGERSGTAGTGVSPVV